MINGKSMSLKMKRKQNSRISKARQRFEKPELDIGKVTAKIDNKAPRLIPDNYLKSRNLLADAERMRVLDRENLDLVQRINLIHRLGVSDFSRSRTAPFPLVKTVLISRRSSSGPSLAQFRDSLVSLTNDIFKAIEFQGKVDCSNPVGNLPESKIRAETIANNERIAKENRKILKAISSIRATYSTAEFLRDWKRIEAMMEHTARYPLIWKSSKHLGGFGIPTGEDLVLGESKVGGKSNTRTRCFFDIELAGSNETLGRMIFELYEDFAPATCANFVALCRGHEGLTYKGTPFHRILPGYWCQGGDVTKFNGTGGVSIYGDKFADENFTLSHAAPGIISMSSSGPNANDSKFNITFKALPTMNGRRVVFGRLVYGLSNLYKIEELGCRSGKPIKNVIVSKCGVLPRKGRNKDSEGV